ncbi:hypothetical protein BASA81_003497 [Batrachochytrium salamandrivorans]|nr:hypothetical protein BASA81_003497 [Batrachochytrium salamandrivorans]
MDNVEHFYVPCNEMDKHLHLWFKVSWMESRAQQFIIQWIGQICLPQKWWVGLVDHTGHLCVGPQQAPSAYQVLLNDLLMVTLTRL